MIKQGSFIVLQAGLALCGHCWTYAASLSGAHVQLGMTYVVTVALLTNLLETDDNSNACSGASPLGPVILVWHVQLTRDDTIPSPSQQATSSMQHTTWDASEASH